MCVLIFALQTLSDKQYEKGVTNYCQHELTDKVIPVLEKMGSSRISTTCFKFILEWDINTEKKGFEFFSFKQQLSPLEQQTLTKELERFNTIVINDPLTTQWWHDPLDSEITQYVTSSFLHADWIHLFLICCSFLHFQSSLSS